MPRVLLIASRRAYHIDDFVEAAGAVGVDVIVATDMCHGLRDRWPQGTWAMKIHAPRAAAAALVRYARDTPVDGIVPTDERTSYIASLAARELGIRANEPEAARITGNKLSLRTVLSGAGLVQPRFAAVTDAAAAAAAASDVGYPVVVKPLHLSASRGVMRANDPHELALRVARLERLLADPDVAKRDKDAARSMLVEQFVPGVEVAFEGVLVAGVLHQVAIFDKPDPLDGPFFAETIYVTPSHESARVQAAIRDEVRRAAHAIGLSEGPVHAELRLADTPVVLEIAARSIGGLCSRTLRYGAGVSLEALIVNHAVGRAFDFTPSTDAPASGVVMLPVPKPGYLRAVEGVDAASSIHGVRDVVITARIGDAVLPLPEGDAYLGFAFATGRDTGTVCQALRQVQAALRFRIEPSL